MSLFSIESLPAKSLALTSTFDPFRSRGSHLQKYLSGCGSLRKPKSHGWKWPLEKSNISPQGVVKSRGFGIHPPAYRFARMPVTIFGIPWLGTETFKFRGAKDSFKWNLGKPVQKNASPLNCRWVKFFQVSGEKVWQKSIHPKSPNFFLLLSKSSSKVSWTKNSSLKLDDVFFLHGVSGIHCWVVWCIFPLVAFQPCCKQWKFASWDRCLPPFAGKSSTNQG